MKRTVKELEQRELELIKTNKALLKRNNLMVIVISFVLANVIAYYSYLWVVKHF